MKTIFLMLLCALFSLSVFGQSESNEEKTTDEVAVEEISFARDDGSGSPGEVAENFVTTDVPIHCLISLTSVKSAAVKINLIAVAANGFKPETSFITVNYKTNGNQNRVKFKVAPDGVWSAGKYRIDVYIDGKKSDSKDFEIQKSAKETKTEKQPPTKPKQKAKT